MYSAAAIREYNSVFLKNTGEERDILSKKEKRETLRAMLAEGSTFSMKGRCTISLVLTKLDVINTILLMKYGRNVIQMKTGRLKTFDSVCKKLQKKSLECSASQALEKINDLIGVRAVCAYVDDIYQVAELMKKQKDIRILKVKDYIKQPKKTGYQSLHLILEAAIPLQEEIQWIRAELQLRTAAMDYWANLDHQLRYKRGRREAALIGEELQQCAAVIGQLDQRMLEIRRKIDTI